MLSVSLYENFKKLGFLEQTNTSPDMIYHILKEELEENCQSLLENIDYELLYDELLETNSNDSFITYKKAEDVIYFLRYLLELQNKKPEEYNEYVEKGDDVLIIDTTSISDIAGVVIEKRTPENADKGASYNTQYNFITLYGLTNACDISNTLANEIRSNTIITRLSHELRHKLDFDKQKVNPKIKYKLPQVPKIKTYKNDSIEKKVNARKQYYNNQLERNAHTQQFITEVCTYIDQNLPRLLSYADILSYDLYKKKDRTSQEYIKLFIKEAINAARNDNKELEPFFKALSYNNFKYAYKEIYAFFMEQYVQQGLFRG